jgi:hypothetical protein
MVNQVSVLMLFSMFEELCITNKQVFSKCSGCETVLFCTIQLGICNDVWLYICKKRWSARTLKFVFFFYIFRKIANFIFNLFLNKFTSVNILALMSNIWINAGVPYCDFRYVFRMTRCSFRLYLQLGVGGLMSWCTTPIDYMSSMAGLLWETGAACSSQETLALLQTTGNKDEPNIVFMLKS